MTGRAGRYLLASLCCVGLLAVVATGSAAAAGQNDLCEGVSENDSAIVGGVGDTTYTADDDVALYPGSTLTVAYCEDSNKADGDWLTDGDGFDLGEHTGNTYTVTITGENVSGESEVDFADHLAEGEEPPSEGGFAVSVVGGGPEADDGLGVGDEEIEETYQEYLRNVSETTKATAALNETTSDLDAGDTDPGDANETVYSLQEEYENMTDTRAVLLDRLRSAGTNGTVAGAVAAAEAVDDEHQRTEENVTAAANAYTAAVGAETEDSRSTVRLSVLGSLGAGVALGLVAGAAVPLVAARRVKEKMKLSRDVSYDRKTALLPILLGVVAAVAGAAILAERVGFGDLLRVIV